MAIRYSGDVEIRIQYKERGVYKGAVRSPGFRGRGEISLLASMPTSPEAYDRAALKLLREAIVFAKKMGVILFVSGSQSNPEIRRTFQSPCPYRR
jgi:hypothetical protein